mgnify:CR=1 FL=1
MKQAIVFGGSGFIGSHLIEMLGVGSINYDLNLNIDSSKLCDIRKPIELYVNNIVKLSLNMLTLPYHS